MGKEKAKKKKSSKVAATSRPSLAKQGTIQSDDELESEGEVAPPRKSNAGGAGGRKKKRKDKESKPAQRADGPSGSSGRPPMPPAATKASRGTGGSSGSGAAGLPSIEGSFTSGQYHASTHVPLPFGGGAAID